MSRYGLRALLIQRGAKRVVYHVTIYHRLRALLIQRGAKHKQTSNI